MLLERADKPSHAHAQSTPWPVTKPTALYFELAARVPRHQKEPDREVPFRMEYVVFQPLDGWKYNGPPPGQILKTMALPTETN